MCIQDFGIQMSDKFTCPKCGAKNESDAENKCIPDEDSCPMTERDTWEDISDKIIMNHYDDTFSRVGLTMITPFN